MSDYRSAEIGEYRSEPIADRYVPQEVEGRLYKWWNDRGYFRAADRSTKAPFCIVLPPPNVTGQLHLGHALDHSIQDVLVRWKRMSGFNTLWLPGTDHAGIATQSVVERELQKEGISRQKLGREEFLKRVWQWKDKYGSRIVEQMQRLGNSCDWERLTFTLDEGVSRAVRKVFCDLYQKGWIYKGTRLINWSPKLESAISDLEVEYKDTKGSLWHIRYPVVDGSGEVVVATTRPETMLGDTAVCVHPEDERYKRLVGKSVHLPLTGRTIPVIADKYVDMAFGSGVVKITPAHDFNDYEVGQRHGLPVLNILNKNGTLNEHGGSYQGLSVQEARKRVVADLEAQGLIAKVEPHAHAVGHCSRTGAVVEPMISEQWFVRAENLAVPAKRVVESGTTVFEPESWTKVYLHWMSIIQDWCISRQLWWGHRIPAWYCQDCGHVNVQEEDAHKCQKCQSSRLTQDEDVLDTWFSSALWPFSTLGWPADSEAQKTFYPTNILVTGHDIIFFWVARMMMMGLEFKKDVPFRKVYIHGLVRDSEGRKMSKSAGNSLDPVGLIDQHGSDALRFTLMALVASGRDLKFSEQRLEGYRNFMNKLWNATRFALSGLQGFTIPTEGVNALPAKAALSVFDQWLTYRLAKTEEEVDKAMANDRFSDAANTLYSFVWHDFCDWYIEFSKPILQGDDNAEKRAIQLVLAQTLNRVMRLLHPFAPFITEELFQKLPIRSEALIVETFPTPENDLTWLSIGSAEAAAEVEVVKEVISAVRNIRGENRIKPGVEIDVRLALTSDATQKIIGANRVAITKLARIKRLEVGEAGSLAKCAVTPLRMGEHQVDVIVPLAGLVDIEEEIKRLSRAIEKVQKDISLLTRKLDNESFVKNAPPEVVEKDNALLTELRAKVASMQESLNRLQ